MRGKKGQISLRAITRSVSGAAVIGGVFLIALGAVTNKPDLTPIGIVLAVLGVFAAVLITLIIRAT